MFGLILEMFTYPFMVRALCMGVLVAVCSALLGVTLVLKRYSMIGDGLSHVGFGALAIATAMNAAPLAVAIPVVIAAAFLLLRLTENSKIKGDAAVALISTGALAIGVMVVSMTTGMNTDVYNYLFGSILSMSHGDVVLTGTVSAVILVMFVFFYNRIFAVTFDETFARATGLNAKLYNTVIAVLTALIIVVGMRMMGSLLISSLVVFPAVTSMRTCPCRIPGCDQHADMHHFPFRHDLLGSRLDDLPGDGPCDLLPVRCADRGQYCVVQHSGIHHFRSGAEGEGMLAK